MIRRMCFSLGLLATLLMSGIEARAQWGYGGWGWGGWGAATPESAALQGAGMYAAGAGAYNLNTSQAMNINAQTAMMWNEYVAAVSRESARIHDLRVHQEFKKNQRLYDEHKRRLRESPGKYEIENGDALNAALDDLTNPKLGSAAQYAMRAHVPASLVADVPFQNNVERVTLMLDGMRKSVKWPEVFEGERFVKEKETFDAIRDKLRAEAAEGEIKPKSLREAQSYLGNLRTKISARPLSDPDDQKEAVRFLDSCASLLTLLKKPNIQPAIIELRKVEDTTVGNLLGFMNYFNLRFGVAKTLKEKQAYRQLYGILDKTRDRILAEAKVEGEAETHAGPREAAQFLQGVRRGRAPQPPAPEDSR